jgi:tetratricopeptide (TPR) repeat protein
MTDSRKAAIAITISLLSLIFSVSIGVYNINRQKAEDIRSRKEEARQLIEKLIDLREDHDFRVMAIQDLNHRYRASVDNGTKRNIVLKRLIKVIDQIPNDISSQEYRSIAWELNLNTENDLAAKYYQKALNASETILDKVLSLRSFARMQYQSLHNPQEGKHSYEEALLVLSKKTDPYMTYVNAETRLMMAYDELNYGDRKNGFSKAEEAKKLYSQLPESYRSYKEDGLKQIEIMLNSR